MASCGICIDEFCANQSTFTTKCNHRYHNQCLTQWLLTKNTCPLCRCELYEKDESDMNFEEGFGIESQYFIRLSNSIITLDDSLVNKITQRIVELTEYIESNYEIPLKHSWYIDSFLNNLMIFSTFVNTKKYKCMTAFQVHIRDNEIYIDISSKTIYKCCDRQIRIVRYGYQKWRTYNKINTQSSISCV